MTTATVPPARLIAIADLQFAGDEATWLGWLKRLGAAAANGELPGPITVQVRAKPLTGRHLEAAARRARKALGDGTGLTMLNGPAALAARLGFDGVHWPESALPPAPVAGPAFASAAAHSVAALRRAERAGAKAILFAPVFAPAWKAAEPVGLAGLKAAAAATPLPLFALGGVAVERVRDCLAHGAYGVAAVSGVFGAGDPASAARRFLRALMAPAP